MKNPVSIKHLFSLLLLGLLSTATAAQAQDNLVLSQVYGGGGSNNTSASYKTDFIEVFNAGTTAVALNQYSVQYGPAGSTATPSTVFSGITLLTGATLPGGLLQPGQYYLVSEGSAGTGGATLTGADQTGTINLAGGSGKAALVKGTTLLNSGNACSDPSVVNLVGYGTLVPANTCAAGSAPVQGMSISASVTRNASCTNTGNNAADFTAGTPAPRNSTTTLAPCGSTPPVTQVSVSSATANPASVNAGTSTTLSAVVAPGTATTSATVTADLSGIGGSATQALTLGSTANTYSYTYTVPTGTAANTYSLPVTAKDNTNATATGAIALTVTAPGTVTPISTIQANRSTYLNTTVTFNGVITVVKYDGFYVQTASATPGSTGDEGIYVFSGANKNPATAVVGNNVTVTGSLTQYPAPTVSHTPSLEVTSASLTVNSTGNGLPTPIAITAPTATGDINQLRQYESMLVSLPSMTAVGGTDASLVESTETTTSNGQFYVVGTGMPRPFREPGMDFRDYNAATCPTFANCPAATNPTTAAGQARPANVVLYDDNPERLIIESSLGGSNAIDVTAGAVITGATGVVDYTYSTDYPYGDPARIILTAANRPAVTASPLVVAALPLPTAGQFTVAAFNVERFFDPIASNDVYFNPVTGKTGKSSAVDITTAAYARRLQKFSLAVRTVLNNPDILSVEEVENLQVLKDMAAQIDADTTTGTKPGYVAYGTDSTTTFTNDVGGISIGFLVKPSTVNVTAWEQKGNTTLIPAGTSALNDRPSQVLHATINRGAGNKPYPITVISNHLRSLNNVNTAAVQSKKELQAEMLATLIQGYQQAGEHVIAVGDMNAFQFSDGYTDTLGTITGNVGNGVSVQPGKAIVSPAAVDLINNLPAAQQQSYTEWGNAQVLDHAVVTADIAGTSTLAVGHIDADFPVALYNDATTPAAMSDHDPLLAYLALPAPATSATLTGSGTFTTAVNVGSTSSGQQITLTNTGETTISISGFATTGDFAQTNNCGTSLAVGGTCAVNVVFKPTVTGTRTGTLAFSGSATVAPVTLTGTALSPADFTLTDSSSNTTTAVTLAAGANTTIGLKVTSMNGFAGSLTLTCTTAGTAPTGVACAAGPPVTLAAGGSATASVVITTVARTGGAGVGVLPASTAGRGTVFLLALMVGAAVLLAGRRARTVRVGGLLMMLFAVAMGVTGCGGKSGSYPSGTPAGTYTYTVTATAGAVVHTETITLTVQ